MDQILQWVDQYGYIILFLSLCLELIALPVPTEILMSYVGYLAYQHQMNWFFSIFVAAAGSFTGMTIAYWIGFKLGYPFFQRYGPRFHLGPERLDKVSAIFQKHGVKFLLISSFIPGIRHITGYFSGISRIRYRSFAPFSGIGVLIWTGTFISLGKLLGPQWQMIETSAKKYMIITIVLIIVVALAVFLVKKNLETIKRFTLKGLENVITAYQSRRGLTLLIATASAVFIVFVSFSIGAIQDYFGGDYGEFNRIVLLIFHRLFQDNWTQTMGIFLLLSSKWALSSVVALTVLWILGKGQNRLLEMQLLVLLVGGGLIYVKLMHFLFQSVIALFHWSTVMTPVFQNDQLVLAAIVYGFFAFLLFRHLYRYQLKLLTTILVLLILFAVGLGHVFFHLLQPSDIVIGYVFGGLWLSFVVLFLEILRLYQLNFSHAK